MKNENENENENEEMVVAVKPQFAIVTYNIINTHFFHGNVGGWIRPGGQN